MRGLQAPLAVFDPKRPITFDMNLAAQENALDFRRRRCTGHNRFTHDELRSSEFEVQKTAEPTPDTPDHFSEQVPPHWGTSLA